MQKLLFRKSLFLYHGMKPKTKLFIAMFATLTVAPLSYAGGSKPKKETNKAVTLYNDAWEALQDLEFKDAEALLRRSLKENSKFAEAHNNLAYALRKQGEDNFEEALKHYNRAIELEPKLAEPYMYRGVLYIQMDKRDLALADHATLLKLDSKLAAELEWVVANGKEKEPEQFFGVAEKAKG